HMLRTAVDHTGGPVAIRYPRGAGVGVDTSGALHPLPIGRAEVLREGADVALVAVGSMVLNAERAADALAAEGINATVVNARYVKPLDETLLLHLADEVGAIVTIEENAVAGGFGAGVLELLASHDKRIPVRTLGVPDHIFEQASQNRLRELAGLGIAGIVEAARHVIDARGGASLSVATRPDAMVS
ncbi:MAG TPA: transketolase C-terminal domain-containing protein, partial [Thermomicrobiales bacterium]|nr:transketolase C-terminal domain-containing protein [Thermomicrobiales bacterium]